VYVEKIKDEKNAELFLFILFYCSQDFSISSP
jgi:hypothetical protein